MIGKGLWKRTHKLNMTGAELDAALAGGGGGSGGYDLFVKITATVTGEVDPTEIIEFNEASFDTSWDAIKNAVQNAKYIGGVMDIFITAWQTHLYVPLANILQAEGYYSFEGLQLINQGSDLGVYISVANFNDTTGAFLDGSLSLVRSIPYNT